MLFRTASFQLASCLMSELEARGPNEHEKRRHWSSALPAMTGCYFAARRSLFHV